MFPCPGCWHNAVSLSCAGQEVIMFRFMYVDCQHGFYSQELPTESGSSRAEPPEELYSCSLCDCACRLIDLKKHLLESHRGAVHFCDKCEFTVTDLTDLEDQKKTHVISLGRAG